MLEGIPCIACSSTIHQCRSGLNRRPLTKYTSQTRAHAHTSPPPSMILQSITHPVVSLPVDKFCIQDVGNVKISHISGFPSSFIIYISRRLQSPFFTILLRIITTPASTSLYYISHLFHTKLKIKIGLLSFSFFFSQSFALCCLWY